MTKVFSEQPLALPGSAKDIKKLFPLKITHWASFNHFERFGQNFLLSLIGSLFQNDNGSSKYMDILAENATLYYKLNAKEIRIYKQNLTG